MMFKNLQGLIPKYLQSRFTSRYDITSCRQLRIYENILALSQLCNNIYFFCMCAIYGLLTKCEVTMAGYWPSSFFARLWTETNPRSINAQKRTRPISSHLDQTSLVNKGFSLYGFRGNFSCGIQRVVLS